MASVDGLVSGMDTTAVIQQLMQLERIPQARIEAKRSAQQDKVMAYQAVNGKFLALQTAADALTKADTWSAFKVTSSSTSVSGTASSSALTGSYSFEVVALAKAHSELSSHVFSSTSERAAAPGSTITITKGDGTEVVADAGDGSLASVVANINAEGGGVKAAAVQVAPGQYRLSLTSTTTGATSGFSVTGLDHATQDLVVGANAVLGMGTPTSVGPPPVYDITIESTSNTFTEVLPGVTFTVSKLESVTLDVSSDGSSLATKVQAMITAANNALDEIAKQTAFNTATNSKSPLTGDSTVRSLQQRILALGSGFGNQTLSDLGIELTKEGRYSFDSAAFQTAYDADPAAVAARFLPAGGMADGDPTGVTFAAAGDATASGPYVVDVTRAASRAEVRVAGTVTDGDTYTVRLPGGESLVVTAAGDDFTTLSGKLNAAFAAAGNGLIAAVEGGELVVRSAGYGSASAFSLDVVSATATAESSVARLSGLVAGTETVTVAVPGFADVVVAAEAGNNLISFSVKLQDALDAGGVPLTATLQDGVIVFEPTAAVPDGFTVTATGGTLESHVSGLDVQGTIGGEVATGFGQVLTAPVDHPSLDGLALTVGWTSPGSGTFTYAPGMAQRFDSLATEAVGVDGGLLTSIIDSAESAIEGYEDQISSWDRRLELRQTMLKRQYANLETALGKLRNQSNWLSGQLAGIAANNG